MDNLITEQLDFSILQYKNMLKLNPDTSQTPRSVDPSGKIITTTSNVWTSGFFAGSLWYLYEFSNDEYLKENAIIRTLAVEKERMNKRTHDVGFIINCSSGNAFRITKDEHYKQNIIEAAKSLSTRYNSKVGCIRSWDKTNWRFPVIIDNLMNLELLFKATHFSGDSTFYKIAVSHANTTLKNHFRADFSSYHVVDYDSVTGNVISKTTHQGYADESAWARGQAWGLYGYTVCYRETHQLKYLEQAKHIAEFIFSNPNLPKDFVPYWDFNSPDIPNTQKDASAAAIIASALFELSNYCELPLQKKYFDFAEKIIRSLSGKNYRVEFGKNENFILTQCVGNMPKKSEIEVPLIYADYYFIEALVRCNLILKNKNMSTL